MKWLNVISVLIWLFYSFDYGTALPHGYFIYALALKRLKRDNPMGNIYDPPLPIFKENSPVYNQAPYPFPTTIAPLPAPHHKLPFYDPNNPYLDAMTNAYWPNYGLGVAYNSPTQVGGGLSWPTGNALMPQDHFNGTLGFSQPIQVRVGMQGGPFFPYQNPNYMKTVQNVNDANSLQQLSQMQSDASRLSAALPGQTPSGFIPVQQQAFSPPQQQGPFIPQQARMTPQQQMQMQQQQQQMIPQQQFVPQQQSQVLSPSVPVYVPPPQAQLPPVSAPAPTATNPFAGLDGR